MDPGMFISEIFFSFQNLIRLFLVPSSGHSDIGFGLNSVSFGFGY